MGPTALRRPSWPPPWRPCSASPPTASLPTYCATHPYAWPSTVRVPRPAWALLSPAPASPPTASPVASRSRATLRATRLRPCGGAGLVPARPVRGGLRQGVAASPPPLPRRTASPGSGGARAGSPPPRLRRHHAAAPSRRRRPLRHHQQGPRFRPLRPRAGRRPAAGGRRGLPPGHPRQGRRPSRWRPPLRAGPPAGQRLSRGRGIRRRWRRADGDGGGPSCLLGRHCGHALHRSGRVPQPRGRLPRARRCARRRERGCSARPRSLRGAGRARG